MEFIHAGLQITTSCRYFHIKSGKSISFVEDGKMSTATLYFTPGSTSKKISDMTGLPLVGRGDVKISEFGLPKRIQQSSVTLNGFKLNVLSLDQYSINIVIARDTESMVVQDSVKTIIVASKEDYNNPKFLKYLFFSGNLLYLKPAGPFPECWELRNFPKILVGSGKSSVLESESDTVFTLRKRYDDYVVREVDYQDQFILEIRRILSDYGVDLVRINKEVPLTRTSYIQYQFNQTPVRNSHPYTGDLTREIINFRQTVEFNLHTTDMVLFNDFRNKFTNVDLLSNFVEFKTTDKYGKQWTAAVKWGGITEEFNHNYQPDDNSNFAYQCQFMCELYFYEVKDLRYKFLEEIVYDLDNRDSDGNLPTSVHEGGNTITSKT